MNEPSEIFHCELCGVPYERGVTVCEGCNHPLGTNPDWAGLRDELPSLKLQRRERCLIELPLSNGRSVTVMRLIDLPGDRCLACSECGDAAVYVVCNTSAFEAVQSVEQGAIDEITRLPTTVYALEPRERSRRSSQRAEDVPSHGTSLAAILAHALDHDGELLPTTGSSLFDELPDWLREPPMPLPARPLKRQKQRRQYRSTEKMTVCGLPLETGFRDGISPSRRGTVAPHRTALPSGAGNGHKGRNESRCGFCGRRRAP
jgi:hypothetical protein